jgi:Ala-tRNA(Pro) deacylase
MAYHRWAARALRKAIRFRGPATHAMTVFDRLTTLLDERQVAYAVLRHAPVYTSEEAARVRGTPLASGAKALLCKADARFVMFVLPGNRRLDGRKARKALAAKSLRFATRDEVGALTALAPGSIPPFGRLFGLATYCDESLAAHGRINFNAGDHAISVSLRFADYEAVEQPTRGRYAEDG